MNRRAAARREPYAFVVPAEQRDPSAVAAPARGAAHGRGRGAARPGAFKAGGGASRPGRWVVPMQQPASGFAKTLLERQQYPDLRQYPGGPPQAPYDVTAHTLPLLLGVDVVRGRGAFDAELEPVGERAASRRAASTGRGPRFALGHASGDLVALGRLLRDGVDGALGARAFEDGGRFPAGTLLVPGSARRALDRSARELGSWRARVAPAAQRWRCAAPRVGLYRRGSRRWTRAGPASCSSRRWASPTRRSTTATSAPGASRALRRDRAARPAAGDAARRPPAGHAARGVHGRARRGGCQALRAFVEAGGTLVALESRERASRSTPRPAGEGRPRRTSTRRASTARARSCARGRHGAAARPRARERCRSGSRAARFRRRARATVLARYGDGDPLLSGWLLGRRAPAGPGRAGRGAARAGPRGAVRLPPPVPGPELGDVRGAAQRALSSAARP